MSKHTERERERERPLGQFICSRKDKLKEESYIQVISTIRVIRIAQVYRMIRHLPDLQILVETMKASVAELKLWLCSFILISIIFATLIYYAEREKMDLFLHNLTSHF